MSTNSDIGLDLGSKLQSPMETETIMSTEMQEVFIPSSALINIDKNSQSSSSSRTSLNAVKVENVELYVESNICRVCLQEGNIPIYGTEKYGNMIEDLNSFANIKVTVNDTLPKQLCYNCYLMLQSAVQWRKTAMESEAKLLDHIKIIKCKNTLNMMKFEKESVSNAERLNPRTTTIPRKPVNTTPMQEPVQASAIQPLASTSKIEPNKKAPVIKSEPIWSPKSTGGLIIKDLSLIRQEIMKNMPETFSSTATNSKVTKEKLDIKEIIRLHRLKSGKNATKPKKRIPKKRTVEDDKSKTIKKLQFHCKRCNLTFDTKEQCHEHKHSDEHKNCKVPCPVCGQLYGTGYMKVHMEFHNKDDDRKYVCDHCGKEFKSSIIFYQHRKSHTETLAFKCAHCSYRHWDKHVLKRHQRIHMNAGKPFHCTQCPKTFSLKCNLNRHLLTHEGPKFNCPTCQKPFYDKSTLDSHYKSDHLGIKEHVCKICSAAFGMRNKLMKHERRVHKREPFPKGRRPCYLTPKYQNRVSEEGIIIGAEEEIEKVQVEGTNQS